MDSRRTGIIRGDDLIEQIDFIREKLLSHQSLSEREQVELAYLLNLLKYSQPIHRDTWYMWPKSNYEADDEKVQ